MKKYLTLNNVLLAILFMANIIIKEKHFYFRLIYMCLSLYHLYIFYIIIKLYWDKSQYTIKFIYYSILLYLFTYFMIYDPNPIFYLFTYYLFFPDFFKGVAIVLIHTYFLANFINKKNGNIKLYGKNKYNQLPKNDNIPLNDNNESSINYLYDKIPNKYFLSDYIDYIKKDNITFYLFLFIALFFIIIEIKIFFQRNKLWVFFNSKKITLPKSTSDNTTFYITAMIAEMQFVIKDYIVEMKKLINYLGEENVIISIVENGDSFDKTRDFLIDFQNYLNKRKIRNRFILTHIIKDPRRNETDVIPGKNETNQTKEYNETYFEQNSHLRIEYFAKLRNKCFDFLYELPDIDYNNTKIINFNDIIFEYEDIINLISTNNEDYDAVCGLDFDYHFYDTWVSIDLNGNSLRHGFPYFINKEAQDLVINHKPIRVFSCWNDVIVFSALPLKDKKIQFRHEIDFNRTVKYSINSDQKFSYESECTYFHIDLYDMGFTKKFINPEVRVAYMFNYYRTKKRAYPNFKDFFSYVINYFLSFTERRNKYMSNYKDQNIELNTNLENWFLYNKKSIS